MDKESLKKGLKKSILTILLVAFILPIISLNVQAFKTTKVREVENIYNLTDRISIPRNRTKNTTKTKNIQKSKSSSTKTGNNIYESEYNILEHINEGYQGSLDLCWAFANKNLVESYLSIKENLKIEFSARHMDYQISNHVPNSYNREVGSASIPFIALSYFIRNIGPVKEENFPYNTLIENPSISDLNKNIEDIYLEGYTLLPAIEKCLINDELEFALEDYAYMKDEKLLTEIEVNEIRNGYKKHIKEYGAISAVTIAQNCRVENPQTQFVYNETYSNLSVDHNVSIIGWDDFFCEKNPEGSVLGKVPKNPGAWLVSDSNKPFGNQFYYIAYDDIYIECFLIGVNDVSVGKNFNIYEHDSLGLVGIDYLNIDKNAEDKHLGLLNIYEKEDSEIEYLNKVSFMTLGNSSVDVYFIQKNEILEEDIIERKGIKLASLELEKQGIFYHTIDIEEPIMISKGEFAIYLDIESYEEDDDNKRIIYIPMEYNDDDEFKNIEVKEKSFLVDYVENEIISYGCNFIIKGYTSGSVLKEKEYIVSYDLNGGIGDFPNLSVIEGNYVLNNQIPTRDGYKFVGWTPDPKETPIIEDTTFVAKWVKNEEYVTDPNKPKNTATFSFGDGTFEYVTIGEDGYVKNIPTPKPIEGYKFIGWNPDPKKTKANEDTVFFAIWEKTAASDSNSDITPGRKNDETTANIKIPNAGKTITVLLLIMIVSSTGIVFFIKYRKLDI